MTDTNTKGPLDGLRVFDMTRILAGPSATQILGDMGAEIIKIEKPEAGDDTRKWGPPFLQDKNGEDTNESAYYLSCNRNKKSITLDYTKPDGLALAKKLIAQSDILIENYKCGSLAKYGLSYDDLKNDYPQLIYCSLTGFGQTGPYKDRAGYDFLIQGMGGIMSLTGPADGDPYKVGVAVADLMAGQYALNGILAALYHREKTGQGQFVDIGLLDTQVAWLSNAAQYYLTSGTITPRMGNAHPTIVPYEAFPAQDGYIILAVGNDKQFADFCRFAGCENLSTDPRFAENKNRVRNRDDLIPVLRDIISQHPQDHWINGLEKNGVPCGPVNNLEQVFENPQVLSRDMKINVPHTDANTPIDLVGNPVKLSKTPVTYRTAPPTLGQHTDTVLKDILSMSADDITTLKKKGVI